MKNDASEFDPRHAEKGGQPQPQREGKPGKPGQPQFPSKPGQPSTKPGQPQWPGQPGGGQH